MKAENKLKLGLKTYTLVYDWDAICLLEKKFGYENLQDVLSSFTLGQLADIVECGLKKHHPEFLAEDLFKLNPPITYVRDVVLTALSVAYFGDEIPKEDKTENQKKKLKKVRLFLLFVFVGILGYVVKYFGILPPINFPF